VEALVLDKPVIVLNAPTNLRAMVEAGVALDVRVGEDPLPALHRALADAGMREVLRARREAYRPEIAHQSAGGATARIVDLLRTMAGAPTAAAGEHVRVMGP
jgi:hypothetical protein